MRCDLHVHTRHSGMCTVPVMNRVCRESYNHPEAVYEALKRQGMDLVTITDHDSIGAAESLRHHEDFFLSEEVTCRTPRGTELHVGVYGISERDHVEMQRRREDLPAFVAYLEEKRLLFSINHAFSGLTGRRTSADFEDFAEAFPAMETRNGAMLALANRHASALAERWGKAVVGGSDAHTMAGLGQTYTEVEGARSAREFIQGLKQARGRVAGASGSYAKLTRAVTHIAMQMMKETPWTLALAPLIALVPAVTLVNLILEIEFAQRWGRRTAQVVSPVQVPVALERV